MDVLRSSLRDHSGLGSGFCPNSGTLDTVDGSEIRRENHLECIKTLMNTGISTTSTGAGFFSINNFSDFIITVGQLAINQCFSPTLSDTDLPVT